MECRKNYFKYLEKCSKGETTIKSARVGIIDMINQAIRLGYMKEIKPLHEELNQLTTALNLQWKESGKAIKSLNNFVAMVDTSGSMAGDPINAAVGLGIRIAEKSTLGKRVMTFSSSPSWINLDDKPELTDMAYFIAQNSSWECNTNFQAAAKLLIDACIEKNLAPEEVEDLVLVILSDMQIDQGVSDSKSVNELLTSMFEAGGMRTSHKKPYKRPHILYWNLRSTGGFPGLSIENNISMVSGFSPALINNFCKEGISSLDSFTPWSVLTDQLHHERFLWAWNAVQS